jgi:hypothetical protein
VEFNMLSSKLLLITLELEKFFTVDDGTAASSARRCQGNARTLSVDRNNAIKPILLLEVERMEADDDADEIAEGDADDADDDDGVGSCFDGPALLRLRIGILELMIS